MKLSPLQLTRYLVTDICCRANPKFNPEKEMQGALDLFSVDVRINPLEPEKGVAGHSWSLELNITQKKKDEQNFPYEFNISMLGFFTIQEIQDAEKELRFVEVNGSSTLYGMAREQIRVITAAGPWGPMILPTLSFYPQKETLIPKVAPAVPPPPV